VRLFFNSLGKSPYAGLTVGSSPCDNDNAALQAGSLSLALILRTHFRVIFQRRCRRRSVADGGVPWMAVWDFLRQEIKDDKATLADQKPSNHSNWFEAANRINALLSDGSNFRGTILERQRGTLSLFCLELARSSHSDCAEIFDPGTPASQSR
jgi:hypothetical protein